MESIKNKRLLFVTSSLGTKWERYSQNLIKKYYPQSKRLILDGTKDWDPLNFFDNIFHIESDYVIHIDEDCFLLDPIQLNEIINELDKNDDLILAGTPDGGVPYRGHNPCACNLFFIIFKTKIIKELIKNNKDWKNLKFEDSFKKAFPFNDYPFHKGIPIDDLLFRRGIQIRYDEFERYYCFFWLILKSNYKIMYLKVYLNKKYWSSDIYLEKQNKPLVRHMWCARGWDSDKKRSCGKTNKKRYEFLEKESLKKY